MELTPSELTIQESACAYILKNSEALIKKHILDKKPIDLGFVTIFMAGSPGAGKTEFSLRWTEYINSKKGGLAESLIKKGVNLDSFDSLIIRIDVDEIREFLPEYQKTNESAGIKGNAHVIQKAAGKGLDILRNYCLKNEISFLHDGTFGNLKTMSDVIEKSLKDNRKIIIFYIYIDPVCAWNFTKARERVEGRNIVKDRFIDQYFKSRENVDLAKKAFGKEIEINCVLKDEDNKVIDIKFNVESVNQYLKTQYKGGKIQYYSAQDLETKLV